MLKTPSVPASSTEKHTHGGQVSLTRMIDPAPCRPSVRKVAIRRHPESMIGDEKKCQRRAGDATAIKHTLVSLHMEGEAGWHSNVLYTAP